MTRPTAPRRWWVIKNSRQSRCVTKKRSDGSIHVGCGQVHEYLTHNCVPVAFSNPDDWEFFRKETRTEKALTLQERTITFYSHKAGEVIEITEQEARELGCIMDPPASRVAVPVTPAPRRVSLFPMGPMRVHEN